MLAREFDWLYFGTLMQTNIEIEQITSYLARNLPSIKCFYDMNLREGHWNIELVERLSRLANVLKMNDVEARVIAERCGIAEASFSLDSFCQEWCTRFELDAICITQGGRGCTIYEGSRIERAEGIPISVVDTVGAGDAFAAAFLHGHHLRWSLTDKATFSNALGALVASKAGATPDWRLEECERLI